MVHQEAVEDGRNPEAAPPHQIRHNRGQHLPFNDCKKDFLIRANTLMQRLEPPLQKWACVYIFSTRVNGISVTASQRWWRHAKDAWHMGMDT